MIRNLKALGLAAMAVFAMSAVVAQAAQAEALFHSDSSSSFLEGSQVTTNEFSVTTGIVKCTTATFTGTVAAATTSTVRVHPTYTGCKLAGQKAEVVTTGCDYLFHATETDGSAEAILATVDVVCEAGKEITVSKEGCTVTVGSQSLNGITINNTNPGATSEKDVDVTANVTGITYVETGATCAGSGLHHTGTYKGTVTVKGYVDNAGTKEGQTGIWVS